ncbi:MAG: NosD domain-containing protein [Halobacteriota archaeon]|nr:NosD domain-containing protein [Halobacteriota archaeon]
MPVSASDLYVGSGETYTTIQHAVDNATEGDTIVVRDGTYTENVDVNIEHLTIRSENGATSCIVQASDPEDHVFDVSEDYVNISGFTVTGATGWNNAGIYLNKADNCNIFDNSASNNYDGINLIYSDKNTLSRNIVSDNDVFGILLQHSDNNALEKNTLNANKYFSGILLFYSSNNILEKNTESNNGIGILLRESTDNTITNNNITDNACGIVLTHSSNNFIYNNIFNNENNAYDNGNNIWNITKTGGINIIGGPYLGGNYWSDYMGVDDDGDGLGDTQIPYNSDGDIGSGGDSHPLVEVSTPNPATTPPNEEIPEFPSIAIPAAMIMGMLFFLKRRRKNE